MTESRRTDSHQPGRENDKEQFVAILCARLQIGRPVARVDIGDTGYQSWPDKAQVSSGSVVLVMEKSRSPVSIVDGEGAALTWSPPGAIERVYPPYLLPLRTDD